jgi:iduronate 2-sulfatase
MSYSQLMAAAAAVAAAPAPRRNVVMITVDDLRPQLNEAYGMTETITPNLDKFAKGALVFHRAYCQQAVCSPSRNSFMSGRRPVCAVSFYATPILCVCQFVPHGCDICVSTC